MYRRLSVSVDLDAAAKVVGRRCYRYVVLGDVNAERQTFGIDVREMLACLLRIFVCHVEIHVVVACKFHFRVNGTGNDVAWRERQARVIFVHELLALEVAEHSAVAAHGLCNQEARSVAGMIERGRVELYEFHILNRSLGTVDHRDSVACRHKRIGRCLIDCPDTSGGYECDAR